MIWELAVICFVTGLTSSLISLGVVIVLSQIIPDGDDVDEY